MGKILSDRDAARIEATVLDFESRVKPAEGTGGVSQQFWQTTPAKMFRVHAAAAPPDSINSPRAVTAQPFEGARVPELAYTTAEDSEELTPVLETIFHSIPGLHLCENTIVWAIYAYSEWRILFVEQWPVMVQQLEAHGFPTGTATLTLTIDDKSASFEIPHDVSAGSLAEILRDHPGFVDGDQLQTIGGPLPEAAINIMFGPKFTGKQIEPLSIDNSSLSPGGTGLKLRILHPLWSVQ